MYVQKKIILWLLLNGLLAACVSTDEQAIDTNFNQFYERTYLEENSVYPMSIDSSKYTIQNTTVENKRYYQGAYLPHYMAPVNQNYNPSYVIGAPRTNIYRGDKYYYPRFYTPRYLGQRIYYPSYKANTYRQ
jgi:hypothetical protein